MFQVGDYIVMRRGAPYTYTRYKSTGVVVEVNEFDIMVEYDYLAYPNPDGEHTFSVDPHWCKLTKQPSQQEKVCAKIKQMEKRWLKYQSSKKAPCHV